MSVVRVVAESHKVLMYVLGNRGCVEVEVDRREAGLHSPGGIDDELYLFFREKKPWDTNSFSGKFVYLELGGRASLGHERQSVFFTSHKTLSSSSSSSSYLLLCERI